MTKALLASYLLIIAARPLTALPLEADALGEPRALTRIDEVSSSRPPDVLVVRHTYLWDGMPISCRILAADGLQVRLPWETFDAWKIEQDNRLGGLTGRSFGNDFARLRVVLWPRGGPLDTLPGTAWQAYLRTAATDAEGDLTLLGDDDSRQNPAMLSLLGGRTRLAWIEYVRDGGTRQALHAAVALPEGVVVLSLDGSPEAVRRAQPDFASLLTSLEIAPK